MIPGLTRAGDALRGLWRAHPSSSGPGWPRLSPSAALLPPHPRRQVHSVKMAVHRPGCEPPGEMGQEWCGREEGMGTPGELRRFLFFKKNIYNRLNRDNKDKLSEEPNNSGKEQKQQPPSREFTYLDEDLKPADEAAPRAEQPAAKPGPGEEPRPAQAPAQGQGGGVAQENPRRGGRACGPPSSRGSCWASSKGRPPTRWKSSRRSASPARAPPAPAPPAHNLGAAPPVKAQPSPKNSLQGSWATCMDTFNSFLIIHNS